MFFFLFISLLRTKIIDGRKRMLFFFSTSNAVKRQQKKKTPNLHPDAFVWVSVIGHLLAWMQLSEGCRDHLIGFKDSI